MKKILSFFAIGAIVLGMASCGGNEPEVNDFPFQISPLAHSVHIEVTPSQEDVYYLLGCDPASTIDEAGGLETYVKSWMRHNFDYLVEKEMIQKGHGVYEDNNLEAETKHIVYAVYVEKDEESENGYPKMIGKIVSAEFTTPAAEK